MVDLINVEICLTNLIFHGWMIKCFDFTFSHSSSFSLVAVRFVIQMGERKHKPHQFFTIIRNVVFNIQYKILMRCYYVLWNTERLWTARFLLVLHGPHSFRHFFFMLQIWNLIRFDPKWNKYTRISLLHKSQWKQRRRRRREKNRRQIADLELPSEHNRLSAAFI